MDDLRGAWWRAPLRAWIVSRALVLVAALAAVALFGVPSRGVDSAVPEALAYLGPWDTTWYLDIARNGYALDGPSVGVDFTNLAFFPLLPLAMAGAIRIGLNPFVATIVLNHLALLGALLALQRLTEPRWGRRMADLAVWSTALAPPMIVASMAYTEAVVICGAVVAALLATRGRWVWAGLLAAPLAVARPTGVLVAVLLVLLAVASEGGAVPRLARAIVAGVPSLAALASFGVWMQRQRGSWHLPLDAQGAWDRGSPVAGLVTHLPGELWDVVRGITFMTRDVEITASLRDLAFLAVYVWLGVRLVRMGASRPWVAYSALALGVPLMSGSIESAARFGVLAFPLAWPAGRWLADGDDRRRRWAAAAAAAVTVVMVAQLRLRAP